MEAQEGGSEREWVGGAPFTQWTRCFGDLAGARSWLEDNGIEFAAGYVGDYAGTWSGNYGRRSALASLTDVNVAFDLEQLLGLPRTLAYIDAYSHVGRDPSRNIGDFQGLSNIEGPDLKQIAETWIETWLDEFRVKVGKVDFNSEFGFVESSGEFVHSTAAVSPAIVNYPTYPNPAMSVNVFYTPSDRFYFGAAIYDGALADGINTGTQGPATFFSSDRSNAWFLCAEVGYAWSGGGTWGSGRAALGAFHDTGNFARFDGGNDDGTSGLWVSVEQRLWRENPTEEDDQGLAAFVTLGFADPQVSACGSSYALGVEWRGPLPGRDYDVFGFGAFLADMSDAAGAGTPENELALELLYKFQLTPAVSLKPELQYITNPGGLSGVDDALVGLLRVEMLF
ncbi:MAG: carbohydrate porin [Planctomycetes bacterium]|nr:carbohydrate porin [Planctomycetota bacterium]